VLVRLGVVDIIYVKIGGRRVMQNDKEFHSRWGGGNGVLYFNTISL
jgi:hypothetical protein